MNHRHVAVHGAAGVQGSSIVAELVRRGREVVGIGRTVHPLTPATARAADLGDLAGLVEAYRGVDAIVVQLPLEFDPERIQMQVANLVTAVEAARVDRVVFNANAALPPEEIGVPFVDGRVRLARMLRNAVATTTTVSPVFAYMENLALPSSATRIRTRGELAYPIPLDFPMPWLALRDLAGVVADLIEDPDPPSEQRVAGPDALTGARAASEMSAALGRDIRWITIDHDEYRAMLTPHLGRAAAAGVASFYAGPPPQPSTTLAGVVRGATSLREWASTTLSPTADAGVGAVPRHADSAG